MNEARQCAIQQFSDMKREKDELEELFAANGERKRDYFQTYFQTSFLVNITKICLFLQA